MIAPKLCLQRTLKKGCVAKIRTIDKRIIADKGTSKGRALFMNNAGWLFDESKKR